MSLTSPIINRDLAAAREPAPADFLKKAYMTREVLFAGDLQEDPAVFDLRFWRSYRLLHFLARRVLCGHDGAEEAVRNCYFAASHHPPRFESEGAFRCWLLRVLIDEALLVLRQPKDVSPAAEQRISPRIA